VPNRDQLRNAGRRLPLEQLDRIGSVSGRLPATMSGAGSPPTGGLPAGGSFRRREVLSTVPRGWLGRRQPAAGIAVRDHNRFLYRAHWSPMILSTGVQAVILAAAMERPSA
jgi:hypothetical protein